jgi:predicted  nucleic acid-binding Zn-ribbon protein
MEAGRTLTDQDTSMASRRVFHLESQVESLRERVEKQDAEIDGFSRRLSVATTVLTAMATQSKERLDALEVKSQSEPTILSYLNDGLDRLNAYLGALNDEGEDKQ